MKGMKDDSFVTDEVSTAIESAIEHDDALQRAARLLADKALERAMYFLTFGSPLVQMQIIRSLMPAVGRALASKADEDEQLAELRDQMRTLHQSMLDPQDPQE